jgi:hypothetical protein
MMMNSYLIKFSGFMLGFGVLLIMSISVVGRNPDIPEFLNAPITLLPIIPFLFAIYTLFQHVKASGEMHIKINQEAIIFAITFAAVISTILGLLELNQVIAQVPILFFPIFVVTIWGCAQMVLIKRYS